jgi:hypothetical protein
MRVNWAGLVAIGTATLLPASLAVAQTLPASVAACADEQVDAARLACYDRQNPPRHASHEAKTSQQQPATAPAAAQTEEGAFGLSGDILRKKQAKASGTTARELERLSARVTSVSERPHGELLLALDNGQTWIQTERKPGAIIHPGETVTISRGALGGFWLTSESRLSTRVRRLD